MLHRIKKLEGEEKDEVSGCFRDKTPRVGCEASERERWKMMLVSWFGNWVDGMLFIKIGETREEEEQVWVGKGMSSLLGQAEFEVPKGNRGGDTQQAVGRCICGSEGKAVLETLNRSHLLVKPNIETLGVVQFTQGTCVK